MHLYSLTVSVQIVLLWVVHLWDFKQSLYYILVYIYLDSCLLECNALSLDEWFWNFRRLSWAAWRLDIKTLRSSKHRKLFTYWLSVACRKTECLATLMRSPELPQDRCRCCNFLNRVPNRISQVVTVLTTCFSSYNLCILSQELI